MSNKNSDMLVDKLNELEAKFIEAARANDVDVQAKAVSDIIRMGDEAIVLASGDADIIKHLTSMKDEAFRSISQRYTLNYGTVLTWSHSQLQDAMEMVLMLRYPLEQNT